MLRVKQERKQAGDKLDMESNPKVAGHTALDILVGSSVSPKDSTVTKQRGERSSVDKPRKRRKKKLSSRVNMWIRRVHLFSGLFMLPWVLLYGFTALLFNHPTYLSDSRTQIEHFSLSGDRAGEMPVANAMASDAVAAALSKLEAEESSQSIKKAESPNAIFTRQVSGSVENDERAISVVLNLNNGKGYLRNRTKKQEDDKQSEIESASLPLVNGLELTLPQDPVLAFKKSVNDVLVPHEMATDGLRLRSMPNVEFDAIVDGQRMRMRLSQNRERQRAGGSAVREEGSGDLDSKSEAPTYQGRLSIVGQSPRDLSARSFLLRLHMAHGYGVQTNSRWFWAVAVDLMFASMCFWGLSGVVMWWQIKRTRTLGFLLLFASAIVATWLAIGMHWQLVNG